MAKSKTREIIIQESKGTFTLFKKASIDKKNYDFEGLNSLKRLLGNEKARLLHAVKHSKPASIYELAKKLGRTFKSVSDDLKLLERYGFIDFVEEKKNNRTRHRPEIVVDNIVITINI